MQFTVSKGVMLHVLSKVQGITGRKTNLAITTNVIISATGSGLTISATDLETGFEGFFPANIESEGTVAINARKLYEIVREFPSDDIHIHEIENHWIKISNQNVEYHLVGMNPDDFPIIPKLSDVQFFEIDSLALSQMIEKAVIIGGASDDKRAHILGIYVEIIHREDQKIIRMVSTDGSRLSRVDYQYEKDVDLPKEEGVLIPKKGMHEVSKFLEQEGTILIGVKDNNFTIKIDNETIIIRLLEGDFPEYGDIILKDDDRKTIFLDKKLFSMMLRRMSILSSDDYKSVIFNFVNDQLIITSTNPDIGESKESIAIDYKSEPIEVAFNPRYFLEAINVIDSDNVILSLTNEEKPCLIEGEGDGSFLTVIMPMRI
jgi:DNA polymerase-3 subunit beta